MRDGGQQGVAKDLFYLFYCHPLHTLSHLCEGSIAIQKVALFFKHLEKLNLFNETNDMYCDFVSHSGADVMEFLMVSNVVKKLLLKWSGNVWISFIYYLALVGKPGAHHWA